ncbi:hypothetical protein WR25_13916 isoform B [Diploscapter pachys]|nr:hypothetical protein WR25_13916 isoform B [Diploscapter pachys]
MLDALAPEDIRHLRDNIEPWFQKDFISCLPYELSILILKKLALNDLINAAAVSRRWRVLSENEFIWKKRCDEIGITLVEPSYRVSLGWEKSAVSPGVKISNHLGYTQLAEHREIKKNRRYGSVYEREPYKSLIMRRHSILSNWRRGPIRGSCVLKGHEDHVITCLQIHGDMLVTGSDDNTLRVWSIEKGRLTFALVGHTGGVWTSQISEDGKFIVSGSTDRSVKVWNAADGSLVHTLSGHTSTVRCMALSGNILVSGSRDQTLRVWDIERGVCLHVLAGHAAAVRCVQFDGRTVVSGAYDFTVKVWDVITGICKQTLHGHTNRVYSLLFDSERNLVVSGSLDTTIRVWCIVRGVCLCNLTGHTSLTSGMQLKGNILVSCNADGNVRVWDIQKGTCMFVLNGVNGHRAAITSLQFLSDGLVATSSDDGTVKLWDIYKGEFVRDLITLSSGSRGVCIWRLRATNDLLACAIGSRNGTEDTKVILLDFDSVYP